MNIEKHTLEYNNKREIKPLRIICLLGALLSPAIAIIWRCLFPSSVLMLKSHAFFYGSMFFILFLSMYILSYKNTFVRRNAYIFVNVIFYTATSVVLYLACFDKFSEKSIFLLLLVFFAAVLILKKVSHLLIYIFTMGTLTMVLLFTAKEISLNRGNIALFIVLFFTLAFVNMKLKLSTQKELEAKEEHYRKLVEMAPIGVVIHRKGNVLFANPIFCDMIKLSREDIIGKQIAGLIHYDCENDVKFGVEKSFVSERFDFSEKTLVLLDGSTVEVEAESIEVEHMGKSVIMCLFRDITDRKGAEKKLIEAESRYRGLIESTLVGVFLYANKFVYVNPYLEELLDYSKEELYNMTIFDVVHPEDRYLIGQYDQNRLSTDTRIQYRILRRDKSVVFVEAHAAETIYDGSPTIIVTLLDISHIKKTEEQIKFIAYHDSLTGLPNRYMLNDYIDKAISSNNTAGFENTMMGIMLVDLDRFKIINDSLGHSFGDMVLKEAAQRLKNCVGGNDVVFRYGGDEFVILLSDTDIRKCADAAKKITKAFRHPFIINEQRTFSTISIGISLFPEDGSNAETLIKNADVAMYVVKDIGRNNYQFYHESFNKELLRKMELENGLRKALENDEFSLYYQPQIDLNSGKIVGLEALIRWHHPEYGMVYPAEFIPLAEETGLIVPIGKWVLETACRQNKTWQEMGLDCIPVAVNVSAYQILHSDLASIVSEALDKTKLDPQYLILEITESIMQDIKKTDRIINDLKSFDVKVAIDDFGTGYSSISLLKNLKFDILKIDPSFTFELKNDKNSIDLIKLIIDFACQRSYSIIAEGIEDEEQAKILTEKGCNWGQGFYYSEPIPAGSIGEFLNDSASMMDAL